MNDEIPTSSELHKAVSKRFDGDALGRGKWWVIEGGHTYIEICKMPFLRWGESVADIGKYILGFGGPVLVFIILEWIASGDFM